MKRALIVTYYWPPAGGPGVQRWLKFVKYFADFNVKPIVYIPENPTYPLVDENFIAEIPADLEILKHPIKEPYRFAKVFSKQKTKKMSSGIMPKKESSVLEKLMLYIRGNFFIPDARVGWVNPSVKFLSEYIEQNLVDVVITTGPPHSLHLIGMRLKEKLGINWIADFRDPWTTIHYHKSLRLNKASQRKHKRLEAKALNNADVVTVTSPTTKKEFELLTNTPIEVVTNGFDVSEVSEVPLDSSFTISHIGSLLSERNPELLWELLSEIANENLNFAKTLQLKFAGAVSDTVKTSLENYKLAENCKFLGYVPHKEALQLQRQSQVLLLLEINSAETRAIIPGKLFEYLAAQRPILALGPVGSDIETILNETNSGFFFNYSEKEALKAKIISLYETYLKGNLKVDSNSIEQFSRKSVTKKMASVITRF